MFGAKAERGDAFVAVVETAGRQSLAFTDPLGARDVTDPPNVRTLVMASTQHASASLPLAAQPPFGSCQQQPNPNPQGPTLRALLNAFASWVRDGTAPPSSVTPRIADATLVPAGQVKFSRIPANQCGGTARPAVRWIPVFNPLQVLDFGPQFVAAEASGVITRDPPRVGAERYGILVPQVDADGNDLGGLRSLHLQVPIGTYTGWNLGRADRFEDGLCSLQGSFIPFAATRAEREAAGDSRPSIEERYPTREAYVDAIRRSAASLVDQRFLLREDAERLIAEAERSGVRRGP